MKKNIIPSIFNINLNDQAEAVIRIIKSGETNMIHFDVMDGKFSQESFDGVAYLSRLGGLLDDNNMYADIHLVVEKPIHYLEKIIKMKPCHFMRASMHYESDDDFDDFSLLCKKHDIKPGLAIKLNTHISDIVAVSSKASFLHLICNDEYSGLNGFQPQVLSNISEAREILHKNLSITADCAIKENNIIDCINGGADFLVMGSAIFNSIEPTLALKRFVDMANVKII